MERLGTTMDYASGWHTKAAAQKEAKFWKDHKIKAIVRKAPGHSTIWNVWVSRKDWDNVMGRKK